MEGNKYVAHAHVEGPFWIPIAAILAFVIGSGAAYWMYGRRKSVSTAEDVPGPLYQLFMNKFYIDELYEYTILRLVRWIGILLSWVEKYVLQGIIATITYLVNLGAIKGADAQNGQIQIYGMIAVLGLAAVLVIFALTGGYVR